MISRRLAALALTLLAFAGCHEDPTVVQVSVQPSVLSLGINASGGNASSAAGLDGVGGTGGDCRIAVTGNISLGSPSFPPAAPTTPATPSVTSAPLVTPLASTTQQGSMIISGSVTTANGMRGNVTGRFYGAGISSATSTQVAGSPPEVGGTFAVFTPGIGAVAGAFGAK